MLTILSFTNRVAVKYQNPKLTDCHINPWDWEHVTCKDTKGFPLPWNQSQQERGIERDFSSHVNLKIFHLYVN